MWPNDRFIKLCGIELPIIQAPMAGSALSDMVGCGFTSWRSRFTCLCVTERGASTSGA